MIRDMTDFSSQDGVTAKALARLRELQNKTFSRNKPSHETPPNPGPEKKNRRTVPLWGTITTGTVALFLGIPLGTTSSVNAIDQQEHKALKQELESTTSELKEQQETHKKAVAHITEDRDALAEQLATSKDDVAKAMEEKEQAVAAHLEAVALQEAAEQREAEATARATAAEAVANSTPRQFASTPEPATTPTYFKNCTAARAAGAAPVYQGDPGYGPHLDRDGDGIGCE